MLSADTDFSTRAFYDVLERQWSRFASLKSSSVCRCGLLEKDQRDLQDSSLMFKADQIKPDPLSILSSPQSPACRFHLSVSVLFCRSSREQSKQPVHSAGLLLPAISIFNTCFEQLAHRKAAQCCSSGILLLGTVHISFKLWYKQEE